MAEILYTNQRGVNAPLHVFLYPASNKIEEPTKYTLVAPDVVLSSYGNVEGYRFILNGVGFGYDVNDNPISGTIESLEIQDASGNTIATATGINKSLADFYTTLMSSGSEDAIDELFSTSDHYIGTTSIDHLQTSGMGDTLEGMDGDDFLTADESNATLIGGAGDDEFIINAQSTLSDIVVIGGNADGTSVGDEMDTVVIRQSVEFAKIVAIDAVAFLGSDLKATIGTDMLGPNGLSPTLRVGVAPSTATATLVINRTGTGAANLDLSGWTVSTRLTTEVNLLAGDTSQHDQVVGTVSSDIISAGAGNDTIDGSLGNDTLKGGEGDDRLISTSTRNVTGGAVGEVIDGGSGIDLAVIDRMRKTEAFEFDLTSLGPQKLADGTETSGIERVDFVGGSGNDKLTGGALADTLEGYLGADTLNGGGGDDELYGGSGIDSLIGGTGNDTFLIRDAGDTIVEVAGQGTDTVLTTLDFSLAALGAVENLKVEKAEDVTAISLTGNALANTLVGNAGKNTLKGSSGNDRLEGLLGDDLIYGGTGKDILAGGAGKDLFVFESRPNKKTNVDTILDFSAKDDTIRLENAIFKGLKKTGTVSKSAFVLGTKAKDANDRILYNKKTGDVFYDADGTGRSAAVKILKIAEKVALTHKDFFVI
ncbi:calcium-binding protein [Microvirga splendida]|uniref:Calcium-binding protein n=1 Tax=Microvirga splendida TaxID=2795727 RepID=A0ABS0Y676_9HYPH|nr:calcium-binding protein [Microvirga splendida]MBJ6127793.1 calcium-binding protein [Microvirga splendida]